MKYKKFIRLWAILFLVFSPFFAHAAVTTYTITDADATVQQMSLNATSLSNTAAGPASSLASGGNVYNYFAVVGVSDTTGAYTLGQTSAPVDTVMLVYTGAFDPANPVAPTAFNDDTVSGNL